MMPTLSLVTTDKENPNVLASNWVGLVKQHVTAKIVQILLLPKFHQNVDISPPSEINRKSKRTGPFHYKRVRSADYLISRNLEPVSKIWTAFEQSLLPTVSAFLVSTLVSSSLENIPWLYNHVAESQHCQEAGFPIRTKKAAARKKNEALTRPGNWHLTYTYNVVFSAQAEYYNFSAAFRLKIFLYYS